MAATKRGAVILGDVSDVTEVSEVNDWAIVQSDARSATWERPTTGERIKLPIGTKPTARMIEIATLNGAILAPEPQGHPDPDGGDFIDEDEEPASPLDRVVSLLKNESEGGRAEVKIYRIREGEKDAYCGSFTPEQFEQGNLELIRSNWGGGRFRIMVYATVHPSNKFVRRVNEVVEIESSALPPVGVAGAADPYALIMRRLDDMEKRGSSQQQNGMGSMREMLSLFVMMKQAFGGDQPKSSVAEIISAVRDLKELSGDLNPSGGNDLASMGMEVVKMIGAQQNAQPVQHAPQPIRQIQVQPNPVPPLEPHQVDPQFQPTADTMESEEMGNFFVKMMLRAIIKKAAENAPIEPIAADLYVKAPDDMLSMIESELWWEMLIEFEPAVTPHQEWFTRLRGGILAEIAKDEAAG